MRPILTCLLMFTTGLLFAQTSQTKSVLFLGNSYTNANNLPLLTANIAESMGDTLQHDKNTPGGYTLEGHSTNATSLSKIKQGTWDHVVLQEQSQRPSFPDPVVAQITLPFAQRLCDTITKYNACATPMFYMTWGRENGDQSNCPTYPDLCTYSGMQGRLRYSYLLMGQQNTAEVSPVGAVWRDVRSTYPNIELYTADESHPNIAGSYLAACTFYTSIFHKSPEGAWYPNGMDSITAHRIQIQATQTVSDSLSVWMIDTSSSPCPPPVSLEEWKVQIEVFPNPAEDVLRIQTQGALLKNVPYQISSLEGKMVKSGILESNEIVLSELNEGYYVITFYPDSGTYPIPFIKK